MVEEGQKKHEFTCLLVLGIQVLVQGVNKLRLTAVSHTRSAIETIASDFF